MARTLTNNFTEVIFIGLPGPTHHYGGLSDDNVASSKNRGSVSQPREAALQALALARMLMSLGLTVGILPPQLRPYMKELRKFYSGDDVSILAQAGSFKPALLEAMSSSSAMWVANAATVTAPQDTADGQLHVTVANLHTNIHRRIEAWDTYLVLRQIFSGMPASVVDAPLDAKLGLRDEGAANHMRLAPSHGAPGLNIFVYGTDGNPRDPSTARQTLEASQAIIARHKIKDDHAICIKQNPLAIEQGVFHNDVIAVANESMLLVHEHAFALGGADLEYIAESYEKITGEKPYIRVITHKELTVEEAVHTYFFNSQLVSLPAGGMALIAPGETKSLYDGKAWKLMETIMSESSNPIKALYDVDLHQSMRNGGGPACLRLRVPMENSQLEYLKTNRRVILHEASLKSLEDAVLRTYPETLTAQQIDYSLFLTCKEALVAIGICLGLDLLPAATA